MSVLDAAVQTMITWHVQEEQCQHQEAMHRQVLQSKAAAVTGQRQADVLHKEGFSRWLCHETCYSSYSNGHTQAMVTDAYRLLGLQHDATSTEIK